VAVGTGAVETLGVNGAFWRGRPVMVTGGSGLLGSWVVRALVEAGSDVVCLLRDSTSQSESMRSRLVEKTKVARGDIRDQRLIEQVLSEHEIVTVIHVAAQAIVGIANRDPVSTFDTNIRGTWSLLEACRRTPCVKQIVVASSDKAYGDQAVLPYTEETPLQGRHPYDVSKTCSDLIAHTYAVSYGLPVAITRCGNFFGGGDLNWNRIVPGTVQSVVRGERPVIRSNGLFVRDYLYVEDGAAAHMLLAERLAADPTLRGEAFNFSIEVRLTVREMVLRILSLMKSTLEPEVRNEASNEILQQCLSSKKARERFGWAPLFSLDEGLLRTIAWYREYLGAST